MFDRIKSFRCKLTLWANQLADGNLAHFCFLQSITVKPERLKDYVDILFRLLKNFEHRFQQFTVLVFSSRLFSEMKEQLDHRTGCTVDVHDKRDLTIWL